MNVAQRYQAGQVKRTLNGGGPGLSKASAVEQVAGRRALERGKEVVDSSVLKKRTTGAVPSMAKDKKKFSGPI